MVLDLAHLEWRRVAVAHQVADQPGILGHPPGAAPVGDPRGLDDGAVVAHVVNDPQEAVVQHRQWLKEQRLQGRYAGPQGLRGPAPRGLDLLALLLGQPHRVGLHIPIPRAYMNSASDGWLRR